MKWSLGMAMVMMIVLICMLFASAPASACPLEQRIQYQAQCQYAAQQQVIEYVNLPQRVYVEAQPIIVQRQQVIVEKQVKFIEQPKRQVIRQRSVTRVR